MMPTRISAALCWDSSYWTRELVTSLSVLEATNEFLILITDFGHQMGPWSISGDQPQGFVLVLADLVVFRCREI